MLGSGAAELERTVQVLAERVRLLELEVGRLRTAAPPEPSGGGRRGPGGPARGAAVGTKIQDDVAVASPAGWDALSDGLDDSSASDGSLAERESTDLEATFDGLSYSLEKSMWDAGMLIGFSSFGLSSSLSLAVGLLINVLLQCSFCWIFVKNKGFYTPVHEHIDMGLEGVWRWRLHYGHALANADPITGSSLVSRVCNQDDSLYMSTAQEHKFEAIQDYSKCNGQYLAKCCVIILGLCTCAELRGVMYFLGGIWSLPRGGSSSIRVPNGQPRFVQVSYFRLGLGTLIAFARAAVVFVIFVSGSQWLVRTYDIEALLLNAVALAFIIDIDELVYALCGPPMVDSTLDQLEPLPLSARTSSVFHSLFRPAKIILLIWITSKFMFFDLRNVSEAHQNVLALLCGGGQDFVFGMDPSGAMFYTSTPPFKGQGGIRTNSTHFPPPPTLNSAPVEKAKEAVVQRIIGTRGEGGGGIWPFAEQLFKHDLIRRLDGDIADMADALGHCNDSWWQFQTTRYLYTDPEDYLEDNPWFSNGSSCEDYRENCTLESSAALRLHCPSTCGCDSPESGLVRRLAVDGCPQAACQRSAAYRGRLDALPCEDWGPERLAEDPGWARLFRGFRQLLLDYEQKPRLDDEADAHWSESFSKLDCPGMMSFLGNESRTFRNGRRMGYVCGRGLAAFCPVTCWCAASEAEKNKWLKKKPQDAKNVFDNECPTSCKAMT